MSLQHASFCKFRGTPAGARGSCQNAGTCRHCLEIATLTDSRKYLGKGWRLKGEIVRSRSQWDEAGAALQKVLSQVQAIANPTQLWNTHLAMGHYHTEARRQQQGRQSYQAACNVIDQVKASLQNPELHAGLENSSLIQGIISLK